MAYTPVNKSSDYFDTKIYTGNGSSQTLDMDNLGLLWMKNRTKTSNHCLFDSVRGGHYTSAPGPILRSNGTTQAGGSDITSTYGITFGSSSSTIGSDGGGYNYNQNSKSYVGWQWRANGTGSANTDGDINSTVSANTTSGFSIVSYTGNGSNDQTVGHGLGARPTAWFIKRLDTATDDWIVYHQGLGATQSADWYDDTYMYLNSNSAKMGSVNAGTGNPTTSVFYVGSDNKTNASGNKYIAYVFVEKTGYSKFGHYVGNGNADGPFCFTGMKPSFLLIKPSSYSNSWLMLDNKRPGFNITNDRLEADGNAAENDSLDYVDLLSNGFKIRTSNAHPNTNTGTLIYMAFGQSIVGSNNIPATAR